MELIFCLKRLYNNTFLKEQNWNCFTALISILNKNWAIIHKPGL